MKVTLLRDHLEHKKGDKIEVTEERKKYWQNIGLVAEEEKEKKEVKHTSKKEIDKPASKHKK